MRVLDEELRPLLEKFRQDPSPRNLVPIQQFIDRDARSLLSDELDRFLEETHYEITACNEMLAPGAWP